MHKFGKEWCQGFEMVTDKGGHQLALNFELMQIAQSQLELKGFPINTCLAGVSGIFPIH